jgi:hypothetical protein
MFDWLFEGRLGVYLFLALVAAAILGLWWHRRHRGYLKALGVVALAALAYFLLDRMIETPREKVANAIRDMADAANERDVDRLLRHLSDDFSYRGIDKKTFRERAKSALVGFDIRNVSTKNLRFLKDDRDAGTMTVRFDAFADNNRVNYRMLPCEADFVREEDGEWRMKTIRFYHPVQSDQEESIPDL